VLDRFYRKRQGVPIDVYSLLIIKAFEEHGKLASRVDSRVSGLWVNSGVDINLPERHPAYLGRILATKHRGPLGSAWPSQLSGVNGHPC
jgi:hypothetical protein